MADWSGQIYVNEGHGRLYHGMTKVRHDGIQEPLQGKKRIIARAAIVEDDFESEWWRELRNHNSNQTKDGVNIKQGNQPMSLFKVLGLGSIFILSTIQSFVYFGSVVLQYLLAVV